MESPPLVEESIPVFHHQPHGLPGIDSTHVMVLPKGGFGVLSTQPDDDFTTAGTFDVNVGRMVFPRR
jgi:hypothetical protein